MNRGGKEIVATAWYEPIMVHCNGRSHALIDWYAKDHGGAPEEGIELTWGYHGNGPSCTAYSILREFFGKAAAVEHNRAFLREYVGKLDMKKGFRIDRKAAARIISAIGGTNE